MDDSDRRGAAMLAHLSGLFGPILIPLLILMMARDSDRFTRNHAKEALNFQISWSILSGVAVAAIFAFAIVTFGLGFLLLPGVLLIGFVVLILAIRAAMAARDGRSYRYPLTFSFLRVDWGPPPERKREFVEVIKEVEVYRTPPPESATIAPFGAATIARLVRVRRGQPIGEFPVTSSTNSAKLVIGRDRRQVQIHIPDDQTVSRIHAALIVDQGRVYIEDLAAQWGTEVNGQRILQRQLLFHNDHIRLGDSEFTFVQARPQNP